MTTSRENNNSYVAGRFVAANYGQWSAFAASVPRNVTGVHTFTVDNPLVRLPDGRNFLPFATNAPIVFGAEILTPSVVSYSDNNSRCTIKATFTVPHSQNDPISSATLGLQEAVNDATAFGGLVTVDGFWSSLGGTTLMITDAVVPGNVDIEDVRTSLPPSSPITLSTTGTSGPATLGAGNLNVPEYQGALTLTTTGSSGAATLSGETLNIPEYSGGTALSLTTTGTGGAATLISDVLNVPEYQEELTLTTTGTGGAATLSGGALNIPEYSGGKASVGFSIATGEPASPAAPYVLAPSDGTVSHAYFSTLTSDGSTDLTFNLKQNGTSVLSGSAATVSAGSTPGTVSTFALTSGSISVSQGDVWELDITSGTDEWTGTVQCY